MSRKCCTQLYKRILSVGLILTLLFALATACAEDTVTPVPQTIITAKPTEMPSAEPTVPLPEGDPVIETAVDFSKPAVDAFDPEAEFPWTQRVTLPRMIWDTENGAAFNEKLLQYEHFAQTLEAGEEGMALYDISYHYSIVNKLVAIVLDVRWGYQYSEVENDYTGFYYDCTKDAELTRDEYIQAMGYDPEALLAEADAFHGEDNDGKWGDALLFQEGKFLLERGGVYALSGLCWAKMIELIPTEQALLENNLPAAPVAPEAPQIIGG